VEWEPDLPPVAAADPAERAAVASQLRSGLNAPLTSSMGRLFDAASSLAGICHRATCEAQAACELEAAAGEAMDTRVPDDAEFAFAIDEETADPSPLLRAMAAGIRAGLPAAVLAARFHAACAVMTLEVCRRLRTESGVRRVALSGGVWQNLLLLKLVSRLLNADGFEVLRHRQVPANDGGLALGQIAVAAWQARG
jgi:hydrogenase maturation protein HypF